MRLEHTVRVDAPLERARAVLENVHGWPDFMSALREVRVIGGAGCTLWLEMRESSGRVRDVSQARVRFSARGMQVVHEGGTLDELEVTWSLAPTGGRTHVRVVHAFRLGWPLVGALLDRLWIAPRIVRPIVARSIENYKVLVERGRPAKPGLRVA